MAQIIWTEPALSDLNQIAEYIALDSFSAAQKLVQHVFIAVERLAGFPELGRIPQELADSQYREIVYNPCRVFYRYDEKQKKVYIIYVMRAERMLRRYLIDERAGLKE